VGLRRPQTRCFICNRCATPEDRRSYGYALAWPASWDEPAVFFVHDECARRAAHVEFDFTGELEAQEAEQQRVEARLRAKEAEAAGTVDAPDGTARNCAFCGKHHTRVKKFITGGDDGEVGICDECVDLITDAFDDG
jgi:hypothetical protein